METFQFFLIILILGKLFIQITVKVIKYYFCNN